MNLADPELELIDPTPNVHALFLQFDKIFFFTKLASRAVVRWSKRMYSCAGVCSYDRGGLCDIALSEPLLKLRPRKDLIETLLHEMIHAFLFITRQDQDRDGHGPNFKEHMYRINKAAGLNISIYHDFHDEVAVYQTHWWRCNGPCQTRKPYFGIVRRPSNRAPSLHDYWWSTHQRNCGGTFVKIKEPEKKTKKSAAENKAKKSGDITKYVNKNINKPDEARKPLTPIGKNVTTHVGIKTKLNGGNTVVITKNIIKSPVSKQSSPQPPLVFNEKGQTFNGGRKSTSSSDVAEAVRNIWANKQLPGLSNKPVVPKRKSTGGSNIDNRTSKMKGSKSNMDAVKSNSPPAKIKKIDEYFKTAATSILKDVYGTDFRLTQSNDKIVAVASKKIDLVDCPICSKKVNDSEINRHLDECLNKDVIEKLNKDNIEINATQNNSKPSMNPSIPQNLKESVGKLPTLPAYKNYKVVENGDVKPIICAKATVDLTNVNNNNIIIKNENNLNTMKDNFQSNGVKDKEIVQVNYDKHIRKSDNLVVVKEEPRGVDWGFLSFEDDMGSVTETTVKIEPKTSKDNSLTEQKCACCGNKINKPMAEHLDECLAFFDNNTTIPEEGASTSFANTTIVIDDDDDDIFDETLTLNATGTKTPCPCCLEMIEMAEMNAHLDTCLT